MTSADVRLCIKLRHCLTMFAWMAILLQHPGADAQDLNTPPVIVVDRHWRIPENTTVGTMITRVNAEDNEDDKLEFGLDALVAGQEQPFIIDPNTGFVFLNSSIEGRAGQNFFVYVTVSDGSVTSKNEVYVNILSKNATGLYKSRGSQFTPSIDNIRQILPPGINLPGISSRPQIPLPPLPSQFTRKPPTVPGPGLESAEATPTPPPPSKQTKTYPDRPIVTGNASTVVDSSPTTHPVEPSVYNGTKLSPIPPVINTTAPHPTIAGESSTPTTPKLPLQPTITTGTVPIHAHPHEETNTVKILLPVIISVAIIFVTAGLIAICFFRKYLCALSKTLKKKNKIDKAKKSNQSNGSSNITSTAEDSRNSIGLSHWTGPMAFSNRYTSPWERDTNGHLQATSQLSEESNGHYGNTHGKSKILTSGDLTSFMYQVARGMDFLTSRGIIHRDLAARNILITDDHTCKVADFGFARDIVTSKVYERKSEGRLPIRWMATESLYDNIFTVKSDIWSFGILMWEIVTLGSTPYPGIAAADVMRKVRDGYRLEKPEHCRRELYNIMFYCWAADPNERPGFPEVVEMLDRLLQTETDYIELERFPDHNYYNMLNMSGEKL
uniref:receptor protein-tyrosine kinase n=1 Tax=Anopheles arabiensis TaxID=7173 RepID=A0A182HN13_ANOAR